MGQIALELVRAARDLAAQPGNAGCRQKLCLQIEQCARERIVWWARRLTPWYRRSDVEDIIQDAFYVVFVKGIRACEAGVLDLNREAEEISAYFRTMAHHAVVDQTRRLHRQQTAGKFDVSGLEQVAEYPPLIALIHGEERERVRNALNRLNAQDRAVLELYFRDGLDSPTIAERLVISKEAARVRIYRALRRLQKALGP